MNSFITVVSGLPRSGTSLMMQMLAAGGMPVLADDVRKADADNPRGYLELEAVKRSAAGVSWVEQAPGKAVKVIYALLRFLPACYRYRVILMQRDVAEVVASQNVMLDRRGRQGASLPAAELRKIFQQEIDRALDWLNQQPNFRTLPVSYGDCVEDPARVAAAVRAFLEPLPLDCRLMTEAVDPSLYRQRLRGGPAGRGAG